MGNIFSQLQWATATGDAKNWAALNTVAPGAKAVMSVRRIVRAVQQQPDRTCNPRVARRIAKIGAQHGAFLPAAAIQQRIQQIIPHGSTCGVSDASCARPACRYRCRSPHWPGRRLVTSAKAEVRASTVPVVGQRGKLTRPVKRKHAVRPKQPLQQIGLVNQQRRARVGRSRSAASHPAFAASCPAAFRPAVSACRDSWPRTPDFARWRSSLAQSGPARPGSPATHAPPPRYRPGLGFSVTKRCSNSRASNGATLSCLDRIFIT